MPNAAARLVWVGPMGRRLLATGILLLVFAAPAAAQPRALWPGVTFDTGVQFTPNGPVAINILTGPRPGGTTTLAPSLSNDTLTGTETLTAIERRTAASATTAGVNGDFFTLRLGGTERRADARGPDREPAVERTCERRRDDATARSTCAGSSFVGTWQGAGARRTLTKFNRPLPGNGSRRSTRTPGARRRRRSRAQRSAILFPFPAAIPNTDLAAPVVERPHEQRRRLPIPPGGAVLVANRQRPAPRWRRRRRSISS